MGLLSKFKKDVKEVPVVEVKEELTQEQRRVLKEQEKYQELSELAIKMAKDLQVEKAEEGTEVVGVIYNEKSKKAYMFSAGEFKLEIGDVVTITDGNGSKRTVMVVVANQKVDNSLLSLPLKEVNEVLYRASEAPKKEEKPVQPIEEAKEAEPVVEVKPEPEKKRKKLAPEVEQEDDNSDSKDRNQVLAELGLTEELLAKLESIPDIDDEKLNAPVIEYKPTEEKVNRMVIPGVGAFAVGEDHKLPKVVYVNRHKTEAVEEEYEDSQE